MNTERLSFYNRIIDRTDGIRTQYLLIMRSADRLRKSESGKKSADVDGELDAIDRASTEIKTDLNEIDSHVQKLRGMAR